MRNTGGFDEGKDGKKGRRKGQMIKINGAEKGGLRLRGQECNTSSKISSY